MGRRKKAQRARREGGRGVGGGGGGGGGPPLPPLHAAAASNDANALATLLMTAGEIDERTPLRNATPLMHACFHGKYLAARLLLEAGASVNAADSKLRTPLHHACYSRSKPVIALVLAYGGDPRAEDARNLKPQAVFKDGKENDLLAWYRCRLNPSLTPVSKSEAKLLRAVEAGNQAKVLDKLDKGRSPDVAAPDGTFALAIAVRAGSTDLVDLLLLHGADASRPDVRGNTPLHWAAIEGRVDIMASLLDMGALLNVPNRASAFAPLHLAASKGHMAAVDMLIAAGARALVVDKDGQTPLFWAARHGHADIVRMLIDAGRGAGGAGESMPDVYGVYPLHAATLSGEAESVKVLLGHGRADVNVATSSGRTALHTAAYNGDANLVQLLLLNGARPSHNRREGDTALHIVVKRMCDPVNSDKASQAAFEATLSTLIGGTTNLNPRNSKTKTPLEVIDPVRAFNVKSPERKAALMLAGAGADVGVLLAAPSSDDKRELHEVLATHVTATKLEMPKGWRAKVTSTIRKRKYFVNKAKGETTWHDPRLEAAKEARSTGRGGLAGPSGGAMLLDSITCALCLELMYRPVTTTCGHSFCHICLSEVFKFKPECPLCRAVLDAEPAVNTVLAEVISSSFPEQYEARRLDAEAMA
ncbi:uncharacterized protein AMSG_06763 [Thecamonas trahens ATCC 50062]|uniref:Uncharacterized protein n=1 Tax=Thecamonas trahens ATCC 50062 TaxID=461836 RepID=A0A0L0DHT0_THETB|nr:hypothetical protein AMSG_06763 [Thecamonas trahens ATCC 50062]KNC50858.1 hypothetical protein AMSG_06763 [Thecamonas trahens ATCC 50062]|eukprot:XP_013756810.1 hypothetical protein AMSG_06763 [Thecamonas trahens ATCC 50062]